LNEIPQASHCLTNSPPGPISFDRFTNSLTYGKAAPADLQIVAQTTEDQQRVRVTYALLPNLPESFIVADSKPALQGSASICLRA